MPGLVSPASKITDLAVVVAPSLVREKICENMPVVDRRTFFLFLLVSSGSAGFSHL